MIKILIADDHQIFLDGLQAILHTEKDIQVVAEALTGNEVLFQLENHDVDIAVLDIEMPCRNGIQLSEIIREKYPAVKVLILTMHDQPQYIEQLLLHDVKGYILKNKGSEQLVLALKTIARGETYFGQELFQTLKQLHQKKKNSGEINLTRREEEILRLIAQAQTTPEIAGKLFIAQSTVETHRRNLIAKLGVKNTLGLVKWAVEKGMA